MSERKRHFLDEKMIHDRAQAKIPLPSIDPVKRSFKMQLDVPEAFLVPTRPDTVRTFKIGKKD